MKIEFYKILDFVEKSLPYGFSKQGSQQVSRVYFEAISVGVSLALRENSNIKKYDLKDLGKSKEFLEVISGKYHTHKPKRIIARIDYVKNFILMERK